MRLVYRAVNACREIMLGMSPLQSRELPFRWLPGVLALSALAAFYLYVFTGWHGRFLPLDDAYITLHNAQVLWTGADPNYGVSALVGATSPLHLAAVALFYPLLGSGASIAVSFAGAALYLLGVERLARRLELPLVPTLLLLLAAFGTGYALFQLVNGLETSLVLAAVTWAIVLAQGAPSPALPLLCGILPFIRPELAILSAALLGRQLHVRWLNREPWQAAADIALAAAAALPWIAWTWAQTGSVLPNTAGAKAAFFAEARLPFAFKLSQALRGICVGLGLMVVPLLLVRPSSLALALWGFVAVFIALFAVTFPGGLMQNYGRYTYALLPGAVWAAGSLWRSRRIVFWIVALSALVMAPMSIFQAASVAASGQVARSDAFGAAAWMRAHVPAGQPVLVHDAGVPSYASDARLVDVVGLKTPSSVAEHQKLTLPSVGARRAEAVDEIARRAGARYAVILDDGAFWADIGKGLALRHWRLDLVRAPGTPLGYAVYRLTPPG